MKKLFLLMLVGLLLILGLVATGGSATAKDSSCEYRGIVNGFAQSDSDDYPYPDSNNTYPQYLCKKAGLKLYKAKASTRGEYATLKTFAEQYAGDKDLISSVAFCKTSRHHGFLLDLAYYYEPDVNTLTKAERDRWERYIAKYDKSHNCVVFRR